MQSAYPPVLMVVYGAGLAGLVAVTLIPLRSWLILKKLYSRLPSRRVSCAFAVACMVVAAAIGFEGVLLFRLVPCLAGEYCGPNRAHALFILGTLGAVYVVLEMFFVLINRMARPVPPVLAGSAR